MQLIFGGANEKVYLTKNLYHVKTSLRKKSLTTLPHPQMILEYTLWKLKSAAILDKMNISATEQSWDLANTFLDIPNLVIKFVYAPFG